MTDSKRKAVEARCAWPCQKERSIGKMGSRDQTAGQAPSILGVDNDEPSQPELRMGFPCSGNTLLIG